MATGSPALRANKMLSKDHVSSSPRQIPFSRMPSLQTVNTGHSLTITPASAPITSSFSNSPYLSSIQCSPSPSSVSQNPYNMASPAPLELPEPVLSNAPATIGQGLSGTKPERLIRKLSTKAKGTLRRKTSSSNQSRRDESVGPVARRRSDSKTFASSSYTTENDMGLTDFHSGLGLNYPIGTVNDEFNFVNDGAALSEIRADVVAPAIPEELVAGSVLTKSTRNRRQDKMFYLDAEGSRISWLGTVVTKSIHIDNIKSIRVGQEAANQWHATRGEHLDIDRCFTINYITSQQSNDIKTLHLVAQSARSLSLWVDTLEALAKHREGLMTGMMGFAERQSILRAHWDSEIARKWHRDGRNGEDSLDLAAITALCRKLHIHCAKSTIASVFEQADERGSGLLTWEQFRNFMRSVRERTDFTPIFNEWRESPTMGITKASFLTFLERIQGIDFSLDSEWTFWNSKTDWLLAKSSCPCTANIESCHIDAQTFAAFLSSDDCRVYAKTERSHQNLDRPLNEYFISSSHNTYLLGRQVNGTSSVEAYVTALRRGCRSVEIDCWDGDNDNPRVTHGFTKTTSVLFVDVVNAINRSAFDASPYPVILSLEVHCNPVQQVRMVDIMKEAFGEKLLLNLLSNHTGDLPSPEELKHRILVKVKATEARPTPTLTTGDFVTTRTRSTSSPYQRPTAIHSISHTQPPQSYAPARSVISPPESFYSPTDRSVATTSASSDDDSDAHMMSPATSELSNQRVKTSKIIPMLAATAPYLQGFSYRGPSDLAFKQFNHIFSVNEATAHTLCTSAEFKSTFEDHNLKHMCRVYPRNTRINSSNFDPNTYWRRGVQMVALNYQTYDTFMQMNQAMFAAGADQTGYVLKPSYLRKQRMAGGAFEHFDHRFKLPRYKVRFSVTIISAQQLPRLASMSKNDGVDPFIEVQMFSAEDKARGIASGFGGEGTSSPNDYHGIGVPYSRRTKVVRDNGYNPQFNDTIDLTLETKYPDLVFVRFIVYQAGKNSRQLAVFTSKLSSLQRGYRHLPLYNSHGEELIFSTLFCRIAKNEPLLTKASLQDVSQRTPRQRSLRTMLSRNMSSDRGRDPGLSVEAKQVARQRRLNKEIEAVAVQR